MPLDGAREKCGVIAVIGAGEPVAGTLCTGLTALQHRGQEAAGIAVHDGRRIRLLRGPGLVCQALDPAEVATVEGTVGIGHVRYSTAGAAGGENSQPVTGRTRAGGHFALAHNGNILTVGGHAASPTAEDGLSRRRAGRSDTHLLAAAIAARRPGSVGAALAEVLPTVTGAFSVAVVTEDAIHGARDRQGFRPLCLGRLGAGWVLASETAALDSIGADFVREVEPGEIVTVRRSGVTSTSFATPEPAACVFEQIYFSRPDSMLGGRRVQQMRRAMGRALAVESPAPGCDVVVPVPETARPAAAGFAERSGIPLDEGLVRNAYVGRTFIRPDDAQRRASIRLKLNPVPEVVRGRRVVLVDDSVVRANSAIATVRMLRDAGATEVHLRISSPPIRRPCFFGVDLSRPGEIAAADRTVEQMRQLIGADSLGYLGLDALARAVGTAGICTGCFTGDYPVDVEGATARSLAVAGA